MSNIVEEKEDEKEKCKWRRYIELEPVKRLRYEGRELLGNTVFVQPKRDGENVSIWLDDNNNNEVRVSSHNMVTAHSSIINRFKETKEYDKAVALLMEEKERYGSNIILYGELVPRGKGATRIEPAHKYTRWYLFDIYDVNMKGFWNYTTVYQRAYHYKLPIIEAIDTFVPLTMEQLESEIIKWKTWAKRHRREGVVLKVYKDNLLIAAKEKIDLPKALPRTISSQSKPIYPSMPEYKILRALQHAWDELTANALTEEEKIALWKDKAKAMPVIARHVSAEAREHYYMVPRNLYAIYLNTDVSLIKTSQSQKVN